MSAKYPLTILASGQQGELQVGDTLQTGAAAAGNASLNAPHGTAPTSPVDGDFWSTTAGFYAQVNGTTVGPLGSGGSLPTIGSGNLLANATGSSAAASDTTLTALLDEVYGSTVGQLIVRGSSVWQALAPSSTAGLALVSNGSGAVPSYQAIGTGAGGGRTQLAQVVTSAGQTSFTLMSSIPQTYSKLVIEAVAGSTSTSTTGTDGWFIRYNNDTGNNYQNEAAGFYPTTNLFGGWDNGVSRVVGGILPSTGTSGLTEGLSTVDIIGYTSAKAHMHLARSTGWQANVGILLHFSGGRWSPGTPAAITRIDILTSPNAFSTGSVFTLYGE